MTFSAYLIDHEFGGGAVYVATAAEIKGRGVRDMGMVTDYMAKRTPAIAGLRRFRLTRREWKKLVDSPAFAVERADIAALDD